MNYSQELLTSLLCIVKAIGITALFFTFIVWVLVKTTRWGHQFWLLARGYLSPKRSLKPLTYFVVIVFFNLVSVRLDILFSEWYKAMYDALQKMDAGFAYIGRQSASIIHTRFWSRASTLVFP